MPHEDGHCSECLGRGVKNPNSMKGSPPVTAGLYCAVPLTKLDGLVVAGFEHSSPLSPAYFGSSPSLPAHSFFMELQH